MTHLDEYSLKEIEFRIDKLTHSITGLFPVYSTVNKRFKDLEDQLKVLQDQKNLILEGQLSFP